MMIAVNALQVATSYSNQEKTLKYWLHLLCNFQKRLQESMTHREAPALDCDFVRHWDLSYIFWNSHCKYLKMKPMFKVWYWSNT